MPYFDVGDDWDGLGAVATTQVRPTGLTASLLPRRRAPIGSIVPTLRARRPAGLRRVSASEAAAIRSARQRAKSRLQAVLRLPERQLLVQARTLRGYGFAGFGETDAAAAAVLHDLAGSLRAAYEEIDGLGISPEDQSVLGGTLLGQRAGDISAALGVDVAWQDLVNNASGEFARLRQDLRGVASSTVLTAIGFEHISSVFTSQGQTVESLRSLAQGAHDLYDRYGSEVMRYIVSDASAFGEGGLRRLMEGALGESSGKWLTGANLQRLGSVAQAWIGAGTSGSASLYVSAAGATIAAVGTGLAAASVVVPWGTVVAAVGTLITLLAALLGDEDSPPPLIMPCEGSSFVPWKRNPEAWTAMAMWLVSQDGKFFDSALYQEAQRRAVTVQQVASEQGWFATIDRYTGEVMVRAPGLPGREPAPRRLLDVMDRDAFVLNWQEDGRGRGDPDVFRIFDEMRPAFGLQAKSRWSDTNFLWCKPDPRETLTRFFGAEQFRIQSRENWTSPFRSDPKDYVPDDSRTEIGGGHLDWSWVGEDWFWRLYTRTMVASMYLAGTVPYGARRVVGRMRSDAVVSFSTSVGGSESFYPLEVRTDQPGLWQPIQFPGAASGAQLVLEDGEVYPWAELPARLADQEWRLAHRVPVPSPEVQSTPAETIKRPVAQRCGPPLPDGRRMCMPLIPQRELAPLSVFKRDEASVGMSRGTKIALWTAGGAAALGGGYWAWRRYRRRGG